MATKVIMPALGMAQETGKLLAWLKQEGDPVTKGEVIMEIETDKASVEIEAAASGILAGISASVNQDIPVGDVVAWILEPGEEAPSVELIQPRENQTETKPTPQTALAGVGNNKNEHPSQIHLEISPVARNIAQEHGVDLSLIKPNGNRIQKADVMAFIEQSGGNANGAEIVLASPKARRLAGEYEVALEMIAGSGPDGAVLAADVLDFQVAPIAETFPLSNVWRIMAERMTDSWTKAPHFFLLRQVNASRFVVWLQQSRERTGKKITYTDLLVKCVAAALRQHPRLNASWQNETIQANSEINVGIAVATEEALVVPIIHQADTMGMVAIAARRKAVVQSALDGKLKLEDIQGGTFTISNLGMYNVDAFNAIVNPPQAAILAVGRIADQVVPVNSKPEVQPMMNLNLSLDHRVVDGAKGAQFLDTLATLIEDPLTILD